MKILGIDPGSNILGWALLELKPGRPEPFHIESGFIRAGGSTREAHLRSIDWHLRKLVKRLRLKRPDEAAIEDGYVGFGPNRNPPSQLALAEARGICVAATAPLALGRYSPATVKQAATGKGNADKWLVGRCVQARLRLSFQPSDDVGDAIAVALCHAGRVETREAIS